MTSIQVCTPKVVGKYVPPSKRAQAVASTSTAAGPAPTVFTAPTTFTEYVRDVDLYCLGSGSALTSVDALTLPTAGVCNKVGVYIARPQYVPEYDLPNLQGGSMLKYTVETEGQVMTLYKALAAAMMKGHACMEDIVVIHCGVRPMQYMLQLWVPAGVDAAQAHAKAAPELGLPTTYRHEAFPPPLVDVTSTSPRHKYDPDRGRAAIAVLRQAAQTVAPNEDTDRFLTALSALDAWLLPFQRGSCVAAQPPATVPMQGSRGRRWNQFHVPVAKLTSEANIVLLLMAACNNRGGITYQMRRDYEIGINTILYAIRYAATYAVHHQQMWMTADGLLNVDLHNQPLSAVHALLKRAVSEAAAQSLRIITGRGLHSHKQQPLIRPLVLKLLAEWGVKVHQDGSNEGAYIVPTAVV